jgi:hypothetical protein
MPNLNEEVRIRTTVDNTQADKGLSDLPIKVRKAGQNVEKEFTNAGRKAGDAFARETESRMNKSMRLVGQTFSKYFGEWGRMFGEIFQVGKDISEILPKRGGRGGHGGGGVVVADIASDVGQMAQQAAGNQKLASQISNGGNIPKPPNGFDTNGPRSELRKYGFVNTVANGAATGAAAGGIAGALPGLGIGLGVGALIAGLGYFITKQMEARQQVNEFAKSLNISTDLSKQFLNSVKESGNIDGLNASLSSFVDLLEKARAGSEEAAKALAKIGVTNVFQTNSEILKATVDSIAAISNKLERDVAAMRANIPLETIDAVIGEKQNDLMFGKLANLETANVSGDIELPNLMPKALEERRLAARKTITEADSLIKVDPEKTKEAEAITKAIQQQVEAAKELVDLEEQLKDLQNPHRENGKTEIEQAKDKIKETERQISLANLELDLVDNLVDKEKTKTDLAKLQVDLAKQKVDLKKQELEKADKQATLENSIVENRMKLAKDGKLSMSALAGTNTAAGREAKAIGELESNYTNALASGNSSAAEQIKKRIDQRKLGLVQAGILSPDELQYEERDANGFISQYGFNKADVLAGMANNGRRMTAAELLRTQQARGEQLARGNVAGVANQADFIRGVRTSEYKEEIRGNAASLLEVMNRNGGALPVRALIQ